MLTNSHRLLHLCQLSLIHICSFGEVRLEENGLRVLLGGQILDGQKLAKNLGKRRKCLRDQYHEVGQESLTNILRL